MILLSRSGLSWRGENVNVCGGVMMMMMMMNECKHYLLQQLQIFFNV